MRRYGEQSLPDDVQQRILDAGRLAGSARNKQARRFVVVESRARVERLAQAVYAPENVLGAAFVVAIVASGGGPSGLDVGRAAQNMMLAGWNDGIVSSPNGVADQDAAAAVVEAGEDERVAIVLSFGYPQMERDPERRTAEAWSARANRLPLGELVTRL